MKKRSRKRRKPSFEFRKKSHPRDISRLNLKQLA